MTEHITKDNFFSGAFAREEIDFTEKSIGLLDDRLCLQKGGKFTEGAIQLFQTKVLDPLKTNFFVQEKGVRDHIYTNLTALNQQLKKQELPTVDMSILLDMPEELLIMIGGLAENHHLREVCSKMREVDQALFASRDKHLRTLFGNDQYLALTRSIPDRDQKVKALFRILWEGVKKLNGGKFPSNTSNHSRLSKGRTNKLFRFTKQKLTHETNYSLLTFAKALPGGSEFFNYLSINDFSFNEQVELSKKFIREAARKYAEDGKTSLNLKNLGLTVLPPEIRYFTFIRDLDLSKNKLQFLPDEISELKQLQALNLSGNEFPSRPSILNQLENLEVINY